MPMPINPVPVQPKTPKAKQYQVFVDYCYLKRTKILPSLKTLSGKMKNVKFDSDTFTCDATLTNADLGDLIDEMISSAPDCYVEVDEVSITYGSH